MDLITLKNTLIGPLIVTLIRLLVPLIILKKPLFGAILAMVVDYFDENLIGFLNMGKLYDYQSWDKILDTYYLFIEVYVIFTWRRTWAKYIGISLFVYRMLGAVLFESINFQPLLMVFPNLFENFFIFMYLVKFLDPTFKKFKIDIEYRFSLPQLILICAVLLIPKLYQEYSLHVSTRPIWLGSELIGLNGNLLDEILKVLRS